MANEVCSSYRVNRQTDRQTDRHTHRTTTVTLAHAPRVNQVRRECYHVCMHLLYVNIDKLSVGLCADGAGDKVVKRVVTVVAPAVVHT